VNYIILSLKVVATISFITQTDKTSMYEISCMEIINYIWISVSGFFIDTLHHLLYFQSPVQTIINTFKNVSQRANGLCYWRS